MSKAKSAFESYQKRKKSNAQNTVADLNKRINAEIEALQKVSTPSWGSDSLRQTLDATRESRVRIAQLKQELEAIREAQRALETEEEEMKAYLEDKTPVFHKTEEE